MSYFNMHLQNIALISRLGLKPFKPIERFFIYSSIGFWNDLRALCAQTFIVICFKKINKSFKTNSIFPENNKR